MPRSSGQIATPSRAMRSEERPTVSLPSKRAEPLAFADDAHDRFQRRRLAGAVAPEQRDDLARPHVEVDAVQDVRFAVPGLQVPNRAAGCAFRPRLGESRSSMSDPHIGLACTSGFSETAV